MSENEPALANLGTPVNAVAANGVLLGYCSAGLVAFEMPRQSEAEGDGIALLALLDTVAPRANRWSWGPLLVNAARGNNWRLLQERIYHSVLHPSSWSDCGDSGSWARPTGRRCGAAGPDLSTGGPC